MAETRSEDAAVKPLEQLDMCDVPGVMPEPTVDYVPTPDPNAEPTEHVVEPSTDIPEGSEPAPAPAPEPGPRRDILEVDPSEFDLDQLRAFTLALRDHLVAARNAAERLEDKLIEHRTLMAAMLDSAGGRIKINGTHMRRADARRVKIETGFEGGEVNMRLDSSKPQLWVPR